MTTLLVLPTSARTLDPPAETIEADGSAAERAAPAARPMSSPTAAASTGATGAPCAAAAAADCVAAATFCASAPDKTLPGAFRSETLHSLARKSPVRCSLRAPACWARAAICCADSWADFCSAPAPACAAAWPKSAPPSPPMRPNMPSLPATSATVVAALAADPVVFSLSSAALASAMSLSICPASAWIWAQFSSLSVSLMRSMGPAGAAEGGVVWAWAGRWAAARINKLASSAGWCTRRREVSEHMTELLVDLTRAVCSCVTAVWVSAEIPPKKAQGSRRARSRPLGFLVRSVTERVAPARGSVQSASRIRRSLFQ